MPKGYGFVKFADIESQDKVLRDKEVFIDGRVTQVSNSCLLIPWQFKGSFF